MQDGWAGDRGAVLLPAAVARNTQNHPGGRAVLAIFVATGFAGGFFNQFHFSMAGRA